MMAVHSRVVTSMRVDDKACVLKTLRNPLLRPYVEEQHEPLGDS